MKNIKYNKILIFAIVTLSGCQQISDRLTADMKTLFSLLKQIPTNQNIQTTNNPLLSVKTNTPNINKGIVTEPLQSNLTTDLLKDCLNCPEMVLLPAGKVLIGSPFDEKGRETDESPVQSFSVNRFFLGKYEVTRGQWKYFLQKSGYQTKPECLTWDGNGYEKIRTLDWKQPGFEQTDDHPVVCVSWLDAQAYTKWLSNVTGKRYRLPTEVEWEYAAKAGLGQVAYPWPSADTPCLYANLGDTSLKNFHPNWQLNNCNDGYSFTAPVGSFPNNPWGLFDLQGNVMEWVSSCWSPHLQPAPQSPAICNKKVMKGGGWDLTEKYMRNSYRGRARETNQGTAVGLRVLKES
jgi:formylglycine-generating enzyme required for sulfatase activity